MKRVERDKFLGTLQLMEAGLSSREVLPQAGCYVFYKGQLITFNDETACILKSPLKSLKGAVQAEPLREVLDKLKDDSIELEQDGDELVIKVRRQTMRVRMEKKIELPVKSLEKPTRWKPLPSKFGEAIEFVQSCAGSDDANFAMTCVHITPKFVEACDNWQFARYRLKMPIKRELLVRQLAIKNIISLSMIEFSQSKKWIHFRNAKNLVMSCKTYGDEYRNMTNIAKTSGKEMGLPKGLIERSQLAEVFTKDNVKDNHIKVAVRPGRINISGDGQYGKYDGHTKVDYSGEPFDFLIPPKMLVQLVKNHTECQVNEVAMKAESGRAIFVTSLAKPSEEKKDEKKGKESKETKKRKKRKP